MKSEGRLFQRYIPSQNKIKVYAFDENSNFYRFPIYLKDISFTGVSLESEIEFSSEKLIIVIGKRVIKMKGKKAWSRKTDHGHLTGMNISIEDERSFIYWNTLLLTLNKLDAKESEAKSSPRLTFSPQVNL